MSKNFDDMNEKANPSDSCGGFKGCQGRSCDPDEKDCQECIDDADAAMEDLW